MRKKMMFHVLLFFLMLGVLWLMLILTAAIPNASLKRNMEKSAVSYKNKEAFSFENGDKWNSVSDNYADTILLNVSWTMGRGNPFVSSLDTWYNDGEGDGESVGFYRMVTEKTLEPNMDYTRYWHGSAIFVRLLHLVTNVNGMKSIGLAATLLLAFITMVILAKRGHPDLAIALLASLAAVQIWNIRLSLEYQPAFLLCFLLCPFYLWAERRGDGGLTYLSVAGGVLIAFFDFLTTETVVFLVPMLLVLGVRAKEGRLGSFKKNFRILLVCGLCWLLAYGGTFLMKWVLASLVTGANKFMIAFSSVEERIGGSLLGEGPENPIVRIPAAVAANLSVLFGSSKRVDVPRILLGLLAVFMVGVSMLYLYHKKDVDRTALKLLALLGTVVFIRYMALNNHSYLHEFFTYRALFSPILAVFAGVAISIELPGRKKKRMGKR